MRESHNLTATPSCHEERESCKYSITPLFSTNNPKQTKMPKRESRNITATPLLS